jgi:N-terminal acetyltransferase B complex catalytic subunit
MTAIRPAVVEDLFRFGAVNLDRWTETYHLGFYFHYMTQWPDEWDIAVSGGANAHDFARWGESPAPLPGTCGGPGSRTMGYNIGKSEGEGEEWHEHVTAVTVAPEFRRLGLARELIRILEERGEALDAYFVDLFVRDSNGVAKGMYEKMGYAMYRRVLNYYSGEVPEDALDYRKALSRDPEKKSMVPLPHPVTPEDIPD